MATLAASPKIDLQLTLTINEAEARALDALVGYGTDSFLKVFYEHIGKAYLLPHEKGLRDLFYSIRTMIPPELEKIQRARKAIETKPMIET